LVFFGALAAGLVAVPTSAMLTAEEAEAILADSGAAAVVADPGLPMTVPDTVALATPDDVASWRRLRGADFVDTIDTVDTVDTDTVDTVDTDVDVVDTDTDDFVDTAADEPAFMVYTSGTTGVAKGVLHAHRSAWGRRPMYRGWEGLGAGDVMLHAGAFSWTYTLGVGLTDPWANGATAVVYNGPRDPTVWPRLIEATRATIFAAVPGVYRQLLRHADLDAHDLSSLRHGLVAGEALHPDLYAQWQSAVQRPLYEALGMSEISTFVSSGPDCPTRVGSPGKPQIGRRIAVLDPDDPSGRPLPEGTTGLLSVHRDDPGLMLGYWQRDGRVQLPLRGPWFASGDLVHVDSDGYLHYHGRDDDVMTAMGYRVSPLEVERVLATHPMVAEAGVTEVDVGGGVRIIAAFIVPAEPDEPELVDAATLLAHAAQHLAAYKRPREIIFVPSLPRTANGKVQRRALGFSRSGAG
jgi:acyl-coenzyme A synthetase/AMP-(fatty) acid ligase